MTQKDLVQEIEKSQVEEMSQRINDLEYALCRLYPVDGIEVIRDTFGYDESVCKEIERIWKSLSINQ